MVGFMRAVGWLPAGLGALAGAWILASLVWSHVLFVEGRPVVMAMCGALMMLGLVLVWAFRTRMPK